MGARELGLGGALLALAACATTSAPSKPRELSPAERESLSSTLEPLLTRAGLWHGPADGCAAAFGIIEVDVVGLVLLPHAPCRVRLVVTQGTLAHVDRAGLRALLAHEVAHMQLGHPEARQARADAQKENEKTVKTVSSAGSKVVGLIPGVGGFISKGISTARKATIAAMEMNANAYLPEEERAADAMAAALLNGTEASSCGALVSLLEARQKAPDEDAWEPWVHAHPVSTERIEALAEPCPAAEHP